MRIVHVSLAIFLFISAVSSAQERMPAEEILRWFPMDMYEEINHEETAALLASAHYEELKTRSHHRPTRYVPSPLPLKIMDEAESVTNARRVRVFVYKLDPQIEKKKKRRGARMVSTYIGDEAYAGEGVGENLFVMRYLDPGAVIKKCLEAGNLVETGRSVGGYLVYKTSSEAPRLEDGEYFVVVMKTGEMLAAESEAMLTRMLKTGAGEEASILGDPDYLTCEELLGESGQVFSWGKFGPMFKAVLTYAEKRDASAEDIAKIKQKMESPKHEIADGTIMDLSGAEIVRKDISFYGGEEGALAAKTHRESGKIRMDHYTTVLSSLAKLSVDGNKLIATTTYTKEANKKLEEARQKRERMMEEKKKAAQKKKESGK